MKREEQKKVVKKAKKARSMIMMLLLCILMLSAATYAWFTLSNTAKISNLTMTVGDVTGLQIAEDTGSTPAESDWGSTIEGGTFKGKLLPATTSNGIAFTSPVYNEDGAVESTTATDKKLTTASADTEEGYWIEQTFYLRALGADGETTKIKLADGEGLTDGIFSSSGSYNGTYVLSKGVTSGSILPGAAVRMSFQKDGVASTTVFEPNENYNTVATQIAADNRTNKNIISSTVTETLEGVCSEGDILELDNNKATKITLRIWIEGGDPQCGNEIAAKDIISQLKFVTAEN